MIKNWNQETAQQAANNLGWKIDKDGFLVILNWRDRTLNELERQEKYNAEYERIRLQSQRN